MTTKDKDPQAVLDFHVAWADWLEGDTIASSTWSVPAGLVAVADTFTASDSTIWLSGGTINKKYVVTNSIVTAEGRQQDYTFAVAIRQS
jgi:hypothetical protein